MKQQTLTGFEKYGKTTRRARFLSDMDRMLPWPELIAVVERFYPKVSELGGRPPIPLERMLRIYFLQLWFNLSDPAVEEALYDSVSMRGFVGIDLRAEGAPDETRVCKFRHLLEKHKLGKRLLVAVNEYLRRSGIKIANGAIVDATIITAPSSTKNKDREQDSEMHQTAKGQQWYFGTKAHVGVDSRTKLIHTVLASAANVADVDALPSLERRRASGRPGLHGPERGDPRSRCASEGLHEPQAPRPWLGQRSGEGEEPGQVPTSRQGRARDRGDQADLWLCEGTLPRPCQESASPGGHRGARQPLYRQAPLAACVGEVSPWNGKRGGSEPKARIARREIGRGTFEARDRSGSARSSVVLQTFLNDIGAVVSTDSAPIDYQCRMFSDLREVDCVMISGHQGAVKFRQHLDRQCRAGQIELTLAHARETGKPPAISIA